MLDYFLAKITDARVAIAMRLSAFGVGTAAQIGVGFVLALSSVPLIASGHNWLALPVLLLGVLISAIGRANANVRVAALSAAFDFIVFAAVPFAFALADPARALAAAFLLFGMIAAGAAALFANEDRELANIDIASCIFAFALACLVPQWFSLIAYVLGLLCFIAAGARFALALTRDSA